jgi:hypothetical protein
MSQLTTAPETSELTQLAKLSVSIRGKLQFMDYLVRAAVADVDRYHEETDAGTRIFIRQLIEMHASNLSTESENMRLIGELCNALDAVINDDDDDGDGDDHQGHDPHDALRNGDTE